MSLGSFHILEPHKHQHNNRCRLWKRSTAGLGWRYLINMSRDFSCNLQQGATVSAPPVGRFAGGGCPAVVCEACLLSGLPRNRVSSPLLMRSALFGSGISRTCSQSFSLSITPVGAPSARKMFYAADVDCQDFSLAWHVASEVSIIV